MGSPIPFLNLQYIYCVIISIFGKRCETVPTVDVPNVDVNGGINAATTTVGNIASSTANASGGFWSWLWPFGSSGGSSAGGAGAGTDVGFWAGVFNALPAPIQHALEIVGSVLAFVWHTYSWLAYSVSGVLFLVILSALGGLIFIRLKEWNAYGTLAPKDAAHSYGWSRWQDLLNGAMSPDPAQWKAAIVAADGMLGELLTKLGYHGETTAEQLRDVPENAFTTMPAAWEAHRVKNFVISKKSDFILTQREAFRVMKLYEQVFEEFDFI